MTEPPQTAPAATFRSDVSHKEYPVSERISAKTIRHSILRAIQKEHPHFSHKCSLSQEELGHYREKAVAEYLIKEKGVLSDLEKTVIHSMAAHTTLADKLDGEEVEVFTFGQRVADKVASFGGSWKFIISFAVFIAIWIGMNIFLLIDKPFDPYPFILLNLLLSCLAALQAPVIMMSQNRQEEKDRDRARKDYMINLKSELEIRTLHEKIDHFIMDQQQELFEMQQLQIEMMNDILKQLRNNHERVR